MDGPETFAVRLGRRSIPDRLRYFAAKLHPADGSQPSQVTVSAVWVGLEMLADELDAGEVLVVGEG